MYFMQTLFLLALIFPQSHHICLKVNTYHLYSAKTKKSKPKDSDKKSCILLIQLFLLYDVKDLNSCILQSNNAINSFFVLCKTLRSAAKNSGLPLFFLRSCSNPSFYFQNKKNTSPTTCIFFGCTYYSLIELFKIADKI